MELTQTWAYSCGMLDKCLKFLNGDIVYVCWGTHQEDSVRGVESPHTSAGWEVSSGSESGVPAGARPWGGK